jgi:hypothetical protein
MNGDWVHEIALRDLSLQVTKLASAIAYAEGQGWFVDSPRRKDWICLTRTGEVVAKTAAIARGGSPFNPWPWRTVRSKMQVSG